MIGEPESGWFLIHGHAAKLAVALTFLAGLVVGFLIGVLVLP